MVVEPSLRERSRTRRRAAIERAAMQLFATQGYEATTIADVAAAAEVAPRTVPVYFPAKIDLALAYRDAAARRMIVIVEESAEDESVVDALVRFVRHELFHESEALALHRSMLETNLALRGAHSAVSDAAIRATRAKLAKDLGRDSDDMVVTLVGASVEGVIHALLDLDPGSVDVTASLEIAVHLLEGAVYGMRRYEPAAASAHVTR
jgi:AcrR family transcriptional regulator